MTWNEGDARQARAPQWSPAQLSMTCLLNGVEPVALDQPFTYLAIGLDQAPALDEIAAGAPHGSFYAAACNQLAQGLAGLPQFDFIVTRFDYDRIPAESRRQVVAFIGSHLKPGGIVHTGYKAMPGGSTGHPLQRLLLEYQASQGEAASSAVQGLADAGARYFDSNPRMQALWDELKEQPGDSLNATEPLYFADVAREFAAAKLNFAGAAPVQDAPAPVPFTPEQQDFLDQVADPVLRETLKDYICNTAYRADLFVRGARRMHPLRRQQWLERHHPDKKASHELE